MAENRNTSLWKELSRGFWLVPGLLGLVLFSFLFVFPIWWLAQANGALFTWLSLGLLALAGAGLLFLNLRRSWVRTPPGRRVSEVLLPRLVSLGWIFAYAALGILIILALMGGSLGLLSLGLGIFICLTIFRAWLSSRQKKLKRVPAVSSQEPAESQEP